MIDDPIDDFDKYVTPAKPRRQREYRTDRNNNPIAAAVTTGGRNQFTDALDQAEIPWEHGDPFPNNPKLSTIKIKGDPYEGARAILSNSNALKWYRNTTGKSVLPKYGVRSSADFTKLPIDHQNDIINGIYQSEGGAGKIKPIEDDFDKYVSRETSAPTPTPDDDFEKYVTQQPLSGVTGGMQGQQPKEKVTVGAKPVEFQGETPQEPIADIQNAPKAAPVPFQQARGEREPPSLNPVENLYRIAESTPEPSGSSQQQFEQRRFKAPESLNQGQRVKLNFPSQLNPSPQDVEAAYMKALGPEYEQYNKMHVAQTRQNLVSFHPEQLAQIKRESDGSFYISPRKDALDYLNAYVTSGGDLNKANQVADVNRQAELQAAKSAQEGAKQDVAEVEAARKAEGAEGSLNVPSPYSLTPSQDGINVSGRAVTGPTERFASGIIKSLGGLSSLGGLAPSDFSNYLNRRGEITQLGASLPPLTAEGKEIQKNVPEKVATALGDLGYTVFEIAALKQVTGLSAAQVMALETALKTSDKPASERAVDVAKNYALGSVLDADIGRLTSGAIFGVPAAVEGAQQVGRGKRDPYDVLLDVGIQGGLGTILGGGKSEGLTDLGIERAPAVGVPGEAAPNNVQEVNTRHVDLQRRLDDGTFGKETKAETEARQAQVNPAPSSEGGDYQQLFSAAQDFFSRGGEYVELKDRVQPYSEKWDTLSEEEKGAILASQVADTHPELRNVKVEGGVFVPPTPTQPAVSIEESISEAPKTKAEPSEPSPVKVLSTEVPTEEAAPTTTSARKDQLAVDRAELDLPELPQAERKGWRSSLINAKEKGLDQKAERLADQVLVNPRALDDEQTAGMVLRLQQLKNEHVDLLSKIDGESDSVKLAEHRADLESVEQSFNKITEAVKKSGTEKGRSLASQKLTINQDFDLVSMLNRYKAKTGKEPTPEIRAQIETQQKRIAELEKQLTEKSTKGGVDRIAREVRRENRQRTRKVLDDEAATIKTNLAAEFARIKSQQGVMPSGLAGIDPEGAITKLALKYAKNRFEAGLTDATQLVDDVHGVLSEFADVTKRQVAEMVSGYAGLKPKETKEQLEKTLTDLRKEMRSVLRQADIEAGTISARPEGPRLKKEGPPETKPQIQRRFQKQINEIERRIREQDFAPKAKRGPTVLDSETQKIQVNLERAKQDFQRKLREWQSSQRTRTEKVADLAVNWGRAAKLMYVSTLGKLSSAATGRMVMSPLENLIGEIPHRVMPELSRKATTEGGGFNKAAEVAALWKSGRFRQVLDQLTKGSSDLDVLLGSQKSIDKEMSRGGVLGIPGRVHGAFKEYPRQAEFDRAFIKTLKNYERQGRDIERPDVQLAARMEAFNSAERARFQQRNFVSDTFNSAMGALERKGIAGKAAAKAGRFIFPITRVPVNVVGETLNYTFGLPRAVIETAIRGGVKNLTPEQANNIMRAYKKGGVGLAVMTYAFLHPKQFGGYYQKGDKRDESEPQAGEVMFFGKRIPKVFTHVPILEAAQLAATARRVMDRMAEQGKTDSALEGGLAAGKGLAEQVPFYETPARFFTGQEGSRGIAQAGGELARGMIPGFVQETAKLRDKDAEGRPIPRSPQGSFAERFGQTVEMGIPGLRQRVPINEKIQKSAVKNRYINQMRKGQDVDLDAAVDTGKITKADKKAIEKQSSLTPFQISFDNAFPNQALDRYERLVRFKDPRAREVEDIMSKKAWSLLHSDALTQKQKDDFQVRIDEAGITPVNPQKRATKFTPSFGSRFNQRLGATR